MFFTLINLIKTIKYQLYTSRVVVVFLIYDKNGIIVNLLINLAK